MNDMFNPLNFFPNTFWVNGFWPKALATLISIGRGFQRGALRGLMRGSA